MYTDEHGAMEFQYQFTFALHYINDRTPSRGRAILPYNYRSGCNTINDTRNVLIVIFAVVNVLHEITSVASCRVSRIVFVRLRVNSRHRTGNRRTDGKWANNGNILNSPKRIRSLVDAGGRKFLNCKRPSSSSEN